MNYIDKLKRNRSCIILSILFTFIWGMAAHGYMYFNNSISHDSLNEFIYTNEVISWKIQLGRFFVPIYRNLVSGNITLTWLYGFTSLLYIAFSVILINKLFNIKSKLMMFILAGIFTVNITVISETATYIHDLDVNMLALFMAVLAVYVWKQYKRGFLWGSIFVAVALGFYQSYLSVTITLSLFVLIINLLSQYKLKDVIVSGVKCVCMILMGGILYYVMMKMACLISDITLISGNYNSLDTVTKLSLKQILYYTIETYISTIKTFVFAPTSYATIVGAIMNITVIVLIVIIPFIICYIKKVPILNILVVIGLIFILPYAMNFSRILAEGFSHDLMYYAIWLFYLLLLILADLVIRFNYRSGKLIKVISYIIVFITLWSNVKIANTAYVSKNFNYDAALSMFTRIMSKADSEEQYIQGETPVVFIGRPSNQLMGLPDYNNIGHMSGLGKTYVLGVASSSYYEAYFNYVMMSPMVIANDAVIEQIKEKDAVKQMPQYPQNGYMKMIDNNLVIKLGE